MDFLPTDFEKLSTQKRYLKLSQFKEGESKIRIVSKPIAGWVDWQDNKPFRYRPTEKPSCSFDEDKPLKAFWALYIWDYERQDLFILEITQMSVIKAIEKCAKDPDWGDFTQYDFKISKKGSNKETRYDLTPVPHREMSAECSARLLESPVRLSALYEGKDPWSDLIEAPGAFKGHSERFCEATETLAKILWDSIPNLGVGLPVVVDYLEFCKPRIKQPLGEAVESWLASPEPFTRAFKQWQQKNADAVNLKHVA